ncbi:TolC family protein [Sulfurimonas sp.]|uniref:TolC family protein n=1 Tax=Sulfurimonas sp. TaxID=2022749 RepID=UPI001A0E5D6F|nr:TolC family protein [Sulfurimonas sp.]MBE0513840.1 TolC family protein [Sulfurimonas sp.]
MKKILTFMFIATIGGSLLNASQSLNLESALEILKSQNLEIKSAQIDIESALQDAKAASANHYGKLDFIQDFARSDDAGNVFGFKLSSREATFGDFGANEFMNNMGQPDQYTTPPNDLNYPGSRNYFQSKLKYEVPLFTGFMISNYEEITESVIKIKKLEKSKLLSQKIYETKKSFYDMALLEESISNLEVILGNIQTLENMTKEMIKEGYAKRTDLLEVKSKKGNVERLISQMESNKELLYHYISFLLNQKVTSIQTPSIETKSVDASAQEIVEKNLDIEMAKKALDIKKSMVKVSEASYYPTLGAFAEVSTADDTFLGEANDHKAYTLGARLSWNIFSGGSDSANVEKSRLEYIKMQNQLELANSGIELAAQKIITEIKSLEKDIDSLKKELLLAQEIYKNYEARYREKLASMSDVIIKQSEEIQKTLQLQQTINQRNERVFALEKLANGENR